MHLSVINGVEKVSMLQDKHTVSNSLPIFADTTKILKNNKMWLIIYFVWKNTYYIFHDVMQLCPLPLY